MKPHQFDPISFVFGVLFVAIAAAVALPETPWEFVFGGISFGWLLPLLLIVVGVALLAPVFQRRERSTTEVDQKD